MRYYLDFDFYDGKLFRLRFHSPFQNANYFDTDVQRKRDDLVAVIAKAHGPPTSTSNVSFFDMQPGYVFSHAWNTNADGVAYNIGLAEAGAGNTYGAALWVEWTWLREQYDAAQQQQQDTKKNNSANDF